MQFRSEFFNTFNHAQFDTYGALSSNINGNFGVVTSAAPPRIIQFALKVPF